MHRICSGPATPRSHGRRGPRGHSDTLHRDEPGAFWSSNLGGAVPRSVIVPSRRIPMTDLRSVPAPLWLRLLGGTVLGLMGACLLYAVAVAVTRFSQIGV